MASRHMSPMSLLLLPVPPAAASTRTLDALYGPVISKTLISVAAAARKDGILEIAVPCPELWRYRDLPRGQAHDATQKLLAGVYRLICIIASKNGMELGEPAGLNVRVLVLITPAEDGNFDDEASGGGRLDGPAVDVASLALSGRPWSRIFLPEGKGGESMLRQFLTCSAQLKSTPTWTIERVNAGEHAVAEDTSHAQVDKRDAKHQRHICVAVGGTFDHLHVGHKLLLTMSALLLEPTSATDGRMRRLVVGISGDGLLRKKAFADYLYGWEKRQQDVCDFITAIADFRPPDAEPRPRRTEVQVVEGRRVVTVQITPALALECVEIADVYGPTITGSSITALVVSGETRSGGELVNTKRAEQGWAALEVFEVDVLSAKIDDQTDDTFADKISSTEIRKRLSIKDTTFANV